MDLQTLFVRLTKIVFGEIFSEFVFHSGSQKGMFLNFLAIGHFTFRLCSSIFIFRITRARPCLHQKAQVPFEISIWITSHS